MKAFVTHSLFATLLLLCTFAVYARQAKPDTDKYDRKEVMIPMRDGVKLHAVIFAPKNQTDKLPFLLERTPYGVSGARSPEKNGYVKDMADDGYIFVYEDIRGRYLSEGKYEMSRMSRDKKDPKAIDESTDTYDTIDWLLKNVPNNNGKAGELGISYDGWTSIIAASDPHPAMVAVSEQATPSDMFMNDDLHHNGAFRLSYAFEYAFMEEISKTDSLFQFHNYDTYDWYLKLGPLSNINKKYVHGKLPSWNAFVEHPNYDDYWKRQALRSRLDSPRIAIQHVGGWWDQEDMVGPQDAYKFLEKSDRHNRNFIVIGPWRHGGWAGGEGSRLGNVTFDGQKTGPYFRKEIQAKWFAWYLKGKGDGNFAEAITFQTGSNQWKNYTKWPPKESAMKNIYLRANGKLSFDEPGATEGKFDSYVSDSAKPVPYRARPIQETYGPGSEWYFWLTEDQRFVHNRPDVLSWETDTLTSDLTVTGNLLAKLYAATSGTDADYVVKLIDVYPQEYKKELKMSGYQLMVAADVFRARFRKSFSKPEPMIPGKAELISIDLHGIDHVFKKGHKIMVQVQSTWFPIIDRNPQKYVPNIFEAKESDYIKATEMIYRTTGAASCISLPVVE
ncbi:CocE/NonD family hydrolase [Mucilaginibacter ginsenosidivorans]|uniref:CocE/NonD family hydrolase n=1 Tax=Mucilaginibacter ginsenosidivorans TaxID=398053 RepID=A0A5B8V380_9SPHI|nr:CocE/NonD family hydrolase [Mucilaginibacter ginsenosidivorans]QEC65515.1 CocE/NonD family hydrolase [Mucilaginibacter ginsenosidivorans]